MFSFFEEKLLQYSGLGILGGLLAAAVRSDLREYRIPNRIILFGTAIAFLLHAFVPADVRYMGGLDQTGLLGALGGFGVGLAALLPLYLIGATGAGDVKLMAMVGAFLGPKETVGAVMFTFCFGALIAIACAIRSRVMRQMAHNVRLIVYSVFARLAFADGPSFNPSTETAAKIPYTLAIAVGTTVWVGMGQWVGR